MTALATLAFWVGVIGTAAWAGPRIKRAWERASGSTQLWVIGLVCLVVVPILVAAAVGLQSYVG